MSARKPWSHKYDFGHLLVVGGNWKYSGSPAFNALAAMRSGVDLATVAAPERAADIVAGFSPDLITVPLKGDYFSKKHVKEIIEIVKKEKVTAIAIGGGMGREKETFQAVKMLHYKTIVPFVFDADAIHAIKEAGIKPRTYGIVTPHGGEFAVLAGRKPSENIKQRTKQVEQLAKKLKCIVLLKGCMDIVSDGKKTKTLKKSKYCVYMTIGGTGDTLTGIAGSLLAQKMNSFDAAYKAAVINGKAGEIVGKKKKQGMIASDLLDEIRV